MSTHDKARRAFLIKTAAGVGAAATAGLLPEAQPQPKSSPPKCLCRPASAHAHGGEGVGAFFNITDALTIAALAERIMPGAPGKPGANDAGVLNYIDLALSGAYSDQQEFYRHGLTQLDAYCNATYKKSFVDLAAAQQDEVITALEEGKATGFDWPHAQAFFNTAADAHDGRHVRRPDLRRQQGFCRLAARRLSRGAGDIHAGRHGQQRPVYAGADHRHAVLNHAFERRTNHGYSKKTDVVIVGVGAAGGIIAAELAKSGMQVIGLERGPRLKTEDFLAHDELRYFQRQDLRPNPKTPAGHLAAQHECARHPLWTASITAIRRAAEPCTTARSPGAFMKVIFACARRRSSATARSAIPEDSSLVDWPLSYAELEPYYDRAEYELGISGKAGNLHGQEDRRRQRFRGAAGARISAAAAGHGPGRRSVRCRRAEARLSPVLRRRAPSFRSPINGRPGCTYCGFCQAFGCHVGAKSSILVTKLPEADATGNFKL